MSNKYCGILKVPKGKVRGTPKQCLALNQIRYYGLEPIDEILLQRKRRPTKAGPDLTKEQLKLKKIEGRAKALILESKHLRIILDNKDEVTPTQYKNAQKKMNALLIRRDKIKAQFTAQKKKVAQLKKAAAKKSGSKTAKTRSKTRK
jgi:hypothetical protein